MRLIPVLSVLVLLACKGVKDDDPADADTTGTSTP